LSTYYVAVKEAGDNFDHMAAYFPLVIGNTPLLWLNNLLAGSIKSWADLSHAFTSNFQTTYNHPGNAFNPGRVTMKTVERLRDYTNWFFENHNTCVGVRDDQVVDSYKKGVEDRKIFKKIHESGATTIASLMEVVNKLIDSDEALVNQFDFDTKCDVGTSATVTDLGSKLRKQPSEVICGRRTPTFDVQHQ
jgi:prophage DNA circulation protein